jgi:hypothetical protein
LVQTTSRHSTHRHRRWASIRYYLLRRLGSNRCREQLTRNRPSPSATRSLSGERVSLHAQLCQDDAAHGIRTTCRTSSASRGIPLRRADLALTECYLAKVPRYRVHACCGSREMGSSAWLLPRDKQPQRAGVGLASTPAYCGSREMGSSAWLLLLRSTHTHTYTYNAAVLLQSTDAPPQTCWTPA